MSAVCRIVFVLFFFKQNTAYEMRISDWSSDVCSSDLVRRRRGQHDQVNLVDRNAGIRECGARRIQRQVGRLLVIGSDMTLVDAGAFEGRKRTRLNSSHYCATRMPSSA